MNIDNLKSQAKEQMVKAELNIAEIAAERKDLYNEREKIGEFQFRLLDSACVVLHLSAEARVRAARIILNEGSPVKVMAWSLCSAELNRIAQAMIETSKRP